MTISVARNFLTSDEFKSLDSVQELVDSNALTGTIYLKSYYDGWQSTLAGPKGGHFVHRTGATASSPTVGSPVAPGTIGTGAQAGYYWSQDGFEWVISFDQELTVLMFGAMADGNTEDTTIIESAINFVAAHGGGDLIVPAYDYHVKNLEIAVDNVRLLAYGARWIDLSPSTQNDAVRLTISTNSNGVTVEGLTLYTTHRTGSNWNTDLSGTNITLRDYSTIRNNPELTGNVGTYLRAADGVTMENCNLITGNHIWTSAKNVRITDCNFHGGGDDGIAIKASTAAIISENIVIENSTFNNFSNLVAIGTEVADGAIVRNVKLSNCTGDDVGSVLWVKPGRGDISSYTNGVVEDVHVVNCHCNLNTATAQDVRLSSVLWIDTDNGGKLYNINMENCSLRGRWNNDPVGSRFGLLNVITNGVIGGTTLNDDDTVDGVNMMNCHFIDPYNGAANSGPTPGYPIDGVGNISNGATNGVIKDIKLVDCSSNGSESLGFGVGTNGLTGAEFGKVELIRPTFTNVSTNPATVDQAAGIRAKTETIIRDADITMGTGTTVPISSTDSNDTADVYRDKQHVFNVGDIAAGGTFEEIIFVAPVDCFVPMVDFIVSTDVPQDATNKMTLFIYNDTQSQTIVNGRTTENLDLDAYIQTPIVDTVFTNAGAWMDKGDVLRFQVTSQGTGQNLDMMQALVRYIPTKTA